MAVLYCRSTDGSDLDDGSTWALAKATMETAAVGALAVAVAGDTIWVSDAHAATRGAAAAWTLPTADGLKILCGDDVAEPPTALTATGSEETTGDFAISFVAGHGYVYGLIFKSGTGAGSASDILFNTNASLNYGITFDTCQFKQLATGTNTTRLGVSAGDAVFGKFINCDFNWSAAAQGFLLQNGRWEFSKLTISGTAPTSLISTTADGGRILVENSDLSGLVVTNLVNAGTANGSHIIFRNGKMPAFTNVITGTIPAVGGNVVEMFNCDSADTHIRYARYTYQGSIVQESTIVPTPGASDGDTAFSLKLVSLATGPTFWNPLYTNWNYRRQNTVGSAITVTVEVASNATLTDAECWLEVAYLGTSGFPLGTVITDRAATIIATPANQTTSSVSWASSPGTTQKLAVTFTPQEKGVFMWRVALAKASQTVYVDPMTTVS